jgi:hypothetical protein
MGVSRKKAAAKGPACPGELALPPPNREDYVATVLEQVGAFEERLDEIETDMESTGWDDIGEFRRQLDDLRARMRGLRSRAGELEGLPDADWPDARGEMEESLLEAAGGLEDFAAGLSQVLPE